METKPSLKQHFCHTSKMLKFTLISLKLCCKETVISNYKHMEQSFKTIEAFSIVKINFLKVLTLVYLFFASPLLSFDLQFWISVALVTLANSVIPKSKHYTKLIYKIHNMAK